MILLFMAISYIYRLAGQSNRPLLTLLYQTTAEKSIIWLKVERVIYMNNSRLVEVAKSTGITLATLRSLDYETQQSMQPDRSVQYPL